MTPTSADAVRLEQLDEVLATYLDAVALGQSPGREELIARYPGLAAELAQFFDDRDRFDRLASPLRELSRPTSHDGRPPRPEPGAWPDSIPGEVITRTPTYEPHAEAADLATTCLTLLDYEVVGELGRGGMGVVYKAWQRSLKRLVALKMLQAGSGAPQEERARFLAEAETVARLEHPHIVRIHEVGEQGGTPFYSMAYAEGASLHRRLGGAPLPARQAAGLVQSLARAVHFAHQRGVVHRDLKPSNVLLAGAPGAPVEQCVPKVTDFGLAKRLDVDTGQTRSGAVLGTPSYRAPEQGRGHSKAVGPAADTYALGAVLYELLTGRPPFRAATPVETILQVLCDEPVPPTRLQPTCPPDLETVCLKCLEKEPARRYESAEALADDLRRFLAGEPIAARPAGARERAVKWARRHPAVAALVAVSSLAALLLVAGVVGHNIRLRVKVDEAVAEKVLAQEETRRAEQATEQAIKEKRLAELQSECQPLLEQARAALTRARTELTRERPGRNELGEAENLAVRVRDRAGNEPSLAEVRAGAGRLLDEIGRLRKARDNYLTLFRGRDDALFHLNRQLFTGLNAPESLAAARQAAEKALAPFRVASEADVGPALDDCYSNDEKQQIVLGCYEVLLIVAEAEARSGTADRKALGRALRIVERAKKLVPSAQAYHWRRARYLTLLGEKDEARAARAEAEKGPPTSPLDWFLVGSDRWLEEKDKTEALRHLRRAVHGRSDFFWARFFLAAGLKLQQPDQAKAELTVCIDRRPDFVWSYLVRGFIHGERREFDAAEADFDEAARLTRQRPDRSAEYVLLVNRGVMRARQQRYDDAESDLKKAIALLPDQFHAHLNLGSLCRERGRRDEAVRQVTAALQPGGFRAAVGLAVPRPVPSRWDEALRHFDRAAGLREDLAMVYRERALVHRLRQDWKAALADFRQAIAHDRLRTETPRDFLECGLIHFERGDDQEAAGACTAALWLLRDDALAHRRDFALAHRLRGEALLRLAHGEKAEAPKRRLYQAALRSFDDYLVYGPPVADVYRARALVQAGLDDHAAAVGEYSRALALGPKHPDLLAGRGWAYLVSGMPKQAANDFAEAIRLNPTSADAHNGRGLALAQSGRPVEGAREASKALDLGPATVPTLFKAARVYAQAAAVLDPVPGPTSRDPSGTAEAYRAAAERRLAQALALLENDQKRAEFWQTYVRRDGVLAAVRTRPRFAALAAQADRAAPPAPGRERRPGAGPN